MIEYNKDIEARYPTLIGHFKDGECELHGIQDVSNFICEKGTESDVEITDPSSGFFLNTCGIYIDRIVDKEYRRELLKVLVPKQMIIDGTASFFNEEVNLS